MKQTPFAQLIASRLRDERFVLIDVGASGGIHPAWRVFSPRLTAFGFDASATECARLNDAEVGTDVTYIPGFVGAPASGEIAARRAGRAPTERNPWNRLSVARTMEMQRAQLEVATDLQRMEANAWEMTTLAEESATIVLPEFFAERGIRSIDCIKIDIDGDDFDVLQTLDRAFQGLGVLCVTLEVNFIGGDEPHEHTFHNTDRFMRRNGFDLFALSMRPYSNAALPSRYQITAPAQTESGRPLQGDATYARDVFQDGDNAESLSDEKLLKLAAIYSMLGQPDMAAEIMVRARARFTSWIDVSAALDILAAQAQGATPGDALSYRDYMAAFGRDDPLFYPARQPPPLLRRITRRVRRMFETPSPRDPSPT